METLHISKCRSCGFNYQMLRQFMRNGWSDKKPRTSGWYWVRDGINFQGQQPARVFRLPGSYRIKVFSSDLKKVESMVWSKIKDADYIWKPMPESQSSAIVKKIYRGAE